MTRPTVGKVPRVDVKKCPRCGQEVTVLIKDIVREKGYRHNRVP